MSSIVASNRDRVDVSTPPPSNRPAIRATAASPACDNRSAAADRSRVCSTTASRSESIVAGSRETVRSAASIASSFAAAPSGKSVAVCSRSRIAGGIRRTNSAFRRGFQSASSMPTSTSPAASVRRSRVRLVINSAASASVLIRRDRRIATD